MKKKNLVIATCLVLAILSFLVLPAYAASPTQDPIIQAIENFINFLAGLIEAFINFLAWLAQSFLAFLAKLFGG